DRDFPRPVAARRAYPGFANPLLRQGDGACCDHLYRPWSAGQELVRSSRGSVLELLSTGNLDLKSLSTTWLPRFYVLGQPPSD
ncbi:unnamed protein product, partial [Ectocarpus sp. 12 AP-2014]